MVPSITQKPGFFFEAGLSVRDIVKKSYCYTYGVRVGRGVWVGAGVRVGWDVGVRVGREVGVRVGLVVGTWQCSVKSTLSEV